MAHELLINRPRAENGTTKIALEHFESYRTWSQHLEAHRERYNCRWRFEQALAALDGDDLWHGWCGVCDRQSHFAVPSKAAGTPANLREELVCAHCGMNARVRGALQIAKANLDLTHADLYITEQASPTYAWLQRQFPKVLGSEYTQDRSVLRRMQQYLVDLGGHGDIRFEDVTSLSFGNASLDLVTSFDVLEHVPDYAKALREFARVLRPGGMLVLTAPFISNIERTIVRARIGSDGAIEHLLAPEYHGDPLGNDGILCFYHFGWDLPDVARESGFSKAGMAMPWIPGMGLMDHLWTLVAIR